ncbi:energy transducer TonB [Carboxylicivirga sediminis]|nr:energy transducer TonB [Carboxylicivirga sediminis]
MKELTILLFMVLIALPAQSRGPKFQKKVTMNYIVPKNALQMGIEKVADSTYHYWFRRMINDDYTETFQFMTTQKTIMAERFNLDCKEGTIIRDGLYQKSYKGEVISEGNYRNNHRDGYFWVKNKKGKLIQNEAYKWDGQHEQGLIAYLNSDETIARKTYLRDKKKHGKDLFYYKNGQMMMSCEYANNQKHGELTAYYPDGQLRRVEMYENDSLVSGEMLDLNGSKIPWEPAQQSSIDADQLARIKADIHAIIERKQPDKARTKHLSFGFTLNSEGKIPPKSCRYKTTLNKEVTAAITRYLSQLKLEPCRHENQSVNAYYRIKLNFAEDISYDISMERLNQYEGNTTLFYGAKPIDDSEPLYFIVEQMPVFPGGEQGLRKYISQSVKYPVEAQKMRAQGRVYISFVVDKNGNLKDIKVARSVDYNLDKEALRVISNMPKWIPGYLNGEPVDVSYTIPINFILQCNADRMLNVDNF